MNIRNEILNKICNKLKNDKYFWYVIFGIQLVLEYLLFRSYAFRESVATIPRNMDQTAFMTMTYGTYFDWLCGDYSKALTTVLFESANSAAPAFNAVLLFLFGYSRYSLLLFNFLGLVIAQFGGSMLVYNYTGKRRFQCIYIGMVLMMGTHFIYAGDLVDYRMDYAAACLFILFMLSWGLSLITEEKKYFITAALVSGSAVFVRFNVVVYVVLTVLITECVKLVFRCNNIKKSFLNVLAFGVLCIAGGGWSVLTNMKNFFSYYFTYHLGDMSVLWEYQGGLWDQILFYPKALKNMHLGKGLFYFGLIVLVLLLLKCLILKYKISKNVKVAVVSLSLVLLVQLTILTMDKVKINTTASIMAGVWISVIIILLYQLWHNSSGSKLMEVGLSVLTVIILAAGVGNYAKGTTAKHYEEHDSHIDDIYTAVDKYILESGRNHFTYLMDLDGTYDLMTMPNFKVYEYEKNHKEITFSLPKSSHGFLVEGKSFGVDEVLEAVNECDIICITQNGFGKGSASNSTNDTWTDIRRIVWEEMESTNTFTKLIETDIDGYPVAVFGKKRIDIETSGIYNDGWSGKTVEINHYDSDYEVFITFSKSAQEFIGESGNIIHIFVNDELINTQSVECRGETLQINDLLGEYPVHGEKIVLKIEKFICPLEEGVGDDSRELGVMLNIYQ